MKKQIIIFFLILILGATGYLVREDLNKFAHMSMNDFKIEENIEEIGEQRLAHYSKPQKTIKIAAIGAWSDWREQNIYLQEVIDFSAKQINASKSLNGASFEIVWYDNHNSASQSSEILSKILKEKDIFAIIGPFRFDIIKLLENRIIASNIIHLTMNQNDDILVGRNNKNFFSANTQLKNEVLGLTEWCLKNNKDAKYLLIEEEGLLGKSYGNSIRREFHNNNLPIIGSTIFERDNQTNYIARNIEELLFYTPDASIIFVGSTGAYENFLQNNQELCESFKKNQLIFNELSLNLSRLNLLPDINNNFIISSTSYSKEFFDLIDSIDLPNQHMDHYLAVYAYRLLYLLSDAISQSKTNDINQIVQYMNTQTLNTPIGELIFNDEGFTENEEVNIINAAHLDQLVKEQMMKEEAATP